MKKPNGALLCFFVFVFLRNNYIQLASHWEIQTIFKFTKSANKRQRIQNELSSISHHVLTRPNVFLYANNCLMCGFLFPLF